MRVKLRGRFGSYELIDFLAVLIGYAISGERTLADFFEHVAPFGTAFMALFGRGVSIISSILQRRERIMAQPMVVLLDLPRLLVMRSRSWVISTRHLILLKIPIIIRRCRRCNIKRGQGEKGHGGRP